MAEQLDPLGIDWSFFDACTTPPQGLPYDPARARRRHGRELTPGELGCFASHVALWREAAADPAGRMHVILEDDLLIDPVFFGDLGAVATAFAPYDYLRLYAKVPAGIRREGPFLNRHIARFSGRAYGTQGYLLSAKGAQRFLNSVRRVERPIDDEMDRFWAHGMPTRSIFPAPIIEVQYGSTIEGKRREDATLTASERAAWTVSKASEKVRRLFAANFGQFGSGRR
jgi:glycosyl transferase, family 25